jgi:hypothetical protein
MANLDEVLRQEKKNQQNLNTLHFSFVHVAGCHCPEASHFTSCWK